VAGGAERGGRDPDRHGRRRRGRAARDEAGGRAPRWPRTRRPRWCSACPGKRSSVGPSTRWFRSTRWRLLLLRKVRRAR
jgi:hypothetical protein